MRDTVKLVNAALDDSQGEIVLRGVLDADSLKFLKTAEYQREVLPIRRINILMDAFREGKRVPDVDLGMRGGGYVERDGAFYLQDDVYIIDGLQRITAGIELVRRGEIVPRLGAIVHFNTNDKMERERFRVLNTEAVRLSTNILLRNQRTEFTVMEMLYNLCYDKTFVLYDRVCWDQQSQRSHLITATTLIKVVAILHSGFGPTKGGEMTRRMDAFQKTMNNVGRNVMRDNVKTFFNLVDECWHIRSLVFKESATVVRMTFLHTLAWMFSMYSNFWDGTKLDINRDLRRKIAMFPVSDPQVIQLSGASGKARDLLFQLFVNHINSGKRTNKLVPFKRNLPTPTAVSIATHISHVQ